MNPSPNTGHEEKAMKYVSVADLEKVGVQRVVDALKQGEMTDSELFVSLKKVPLICFHIESIEKNLVDIKRQIIFERESTDRIHDSFITKNEMESFVKVYLFEQQSMKKVIYGCTAAVMLAILANFMTRFISF